MWSTARNRQQQEFREARMSFKLAACIMALGVAAIAASPASAQKKGGTLRLYHNDNPPSTSLLEESTIASVTKKKYAGPEPDTAVTASI